MPVRPISIAIEKRPCDRCDRTTRHQIAEVAGPCGTPAGTLVRCLEC